jgi:phage/plasmid-like protein (TIGR03299 family)
MSHELFGERFFSYREPAWHGLGLVLDKEMGALDAFSAIGSYEVGLEALTTVEGLPLEQRAVVRGPTPDDPSKRVFGVVGSDYVLVSPLDLVTIWDDVVTRPVETIGCLQGGSSIFVTTHLPDINVKGDEIKTYMLLVSPMTGLQAIQIRVTPVRVVCQNTLVAAKAASTEVLRIIHDQQAMDRLRVWLSGVMIRAEQKTQALQDLFNIFAGRQLTSSEVTYTIEKVYPMPRGPRPDAPQEILELREKYWEDAVKGMQRSRTAVQELFDGEGTGMSTPSCDGTAWGLYNSIVEWSDYHGRSDRWAEAQMISALFGERAEAKERAFSILQTICARPR